MAAMAGATNPDLVNKVKKLEKENKDLKKGKVNKNCFGKFVSLFVTFSFLSFS